MIKKLFKVLVKIVGGVFSLAVLAYTILLVINWNDQAPSDIALEYTAAIENREATNSEFAAALADDRCGLCQKPFLAGKSRSS